MASTSISMAAAATTILKRLGSPKIISLFTTPLMEWMHEVRRRVRSQ